TGRIDAFVWQAPPDVLVAPELSFTDDVTADLDDEPKALPVLEREAPGPVSPPAAASAGTPPPSPVETAIQPEPISTVHPVDATRPAVPARPEPVVFPLEQPPDDPGPAVSTAGQRNRFW